MSWGGGWQEGARTYTRVVFMQAVWFLMRKINRGSQISLLSISPMCLSESLPPASPLLCLLPPSCLLLLRNFSCMWFAVSPCAVSPRFMESWTRCHFQLPRIYSPDERMWEGELSDWDVKHLGFTNNKAGQSWRNIVQSCLWVNYSCL